MVAIPKTFADMSDGNKGRRYPLGEHVVEMKLAKFFYSNHKRQEFFIAEAIMLNSTSPEAQPGVAYSSASVLPGKFDYGWRDVKEWVAAVVQALQPGAQINWADDNETRQLIGCLIADETERPQPDHPQPSKGVKLRVSVTKTDSGFNRVSYSAAQEKDLTAPAPEPARMPFDAAPAPAPAPAPATMPAALAALMK